MVETAASQPRVLVLDSDESRAAELSHRLQFLDYAPVVLNRDSIDRIADEPGIAALVGDIDGDSEAQALLQQLDDACPHTPFLMLPDTDSSRSLPQIVNHPAWQLDLPVRRSQLTHLLQRAARYEGRERRQRLTGNSRSIQEVRQLIEQVADFDTNVLVTGESGTGKELVARTIHDLSDRADEPFVPINCGAIPADLLESELFGHEKGAFTGAITARTGRFEMAEGGTLFLDEIGDMSLPMQVKLLRVLQERCFERVGSNKTRKCNVRIIAATHRDLPAAVESGEFREDLFYRLNVFPIMMPPLFKRATDLPDLLQELLLQHQGGGEDGLRVSPPALQALASYSWPGNIRELSNLVERLAILKPSGEIDLQDLPAKYRNNPASPCAEPNSVAEALQLSNQNLKTHLQDVERGLINQAMQASGDVVAKAARLLGMQRTTLVEKLAKYDLH